VVWCLYEHTFNLVDGLLKLLTGNQLLDVGKVDLLLVNGISPEGFSAKRCTNLSL